MKIDKIDAHTINFSKNLTKNAENINSQNQKNELSESLLLASMQGLALANIVNKNCVINPKISEEKSICPFVKDEKRIPQWLLPRKLDLKNLKLPKDVKSSEGIQALTDEFLKLMGHKNLNIETKLIPMPFSGDLLAYFDISKGKIFVNKITISKATNEFVIATIAHELDHFEKFAIICKKIGVKNFKSCVNDDKNFNYDFWQQTSENLSANFLKNGENWLKICKYLDEKREIKLIDSDYMENFEMIIDYLSNPVEISAHARTDEVAGFLSSKNKKTLLENNLKICKILLQTLNINDYLLTKYGAKKGGEIFDGEVCKSMNDIGITRLDLKNLYGDVLSPYYFELPEILNQINRNIVDKVANGII